MARTFTEQVVVYNDGSGGSSGLTGDGEGLHSMLFHDACRGLNNMAVKCNNFGQYAQGLNTGFISRGISGAGYQMFIGQFPVLIPPWRQRMLWTAGVEVTDGTANDV